MLEHDNLVEGTHTTTNISVTYFNITDKGREHLNNVAISAKADVKTPPSQTRPMSSLAMQVAAELGNQQLEDARGISDAFLYSYLKQQPKTK